MKNYFLPAAMAACVVLCVKVPDAHAQGFETTQDLLRRVFLRQLTSHSTLNKPNHIQMDRIRALARIRHPSSDQIRGIKDALHGLATLHDRISQQLLITGVLWDKNTPSYLYEEVNQLVKSSPPIDNPSAFTMLSDLEESAKECIQAPCTHAELEDIATKPSFREDLLWIVRSMPNLRSLFAQTGNLALPPSQLSLQPGDLLFGAGNSPIVKVFSRLDRAVVGDVSPIHFTHVAMVTQNPETGKLEISEFNGTGTGLAPANLPVDIWFSRYPVWGAARVINPLLRQQAAIRMRELISNIPRTVAKLLLRGPRRLCAGNVDDAYGGLFDREIESVGHGLSSYCVTPLVSPIFALLSKLASKATSPADIYSSIEVIPFSQVRQ